MRLSTSVVADLPGGRELAFVDVTSDSRCPSDVQCIWAGEAALLFEWTAPGSGVTRVPLLAAPARGAASIAGGLTLRLIELRPTPRGGQPIAKANYVATVVVEAAGRTSGALGNVSVGPSCPVQRESDPCPDRALAATLVFRDAAGVEVARALSDTAGFYAVALKPGHYAIVPFTPGGATLPRGIPREVDVLAGDWVTADVMYDSGIR